MKNFTDLQYDQLMTAIEQRITDLKDDANRLSMQMGREFFNRTGEEVFEGKLSKYKGVCDKFKALEDAKEKLCNPSRENKNDSVFVVLPQHRKNKPVAAFWKKEEAEKYVKECGLYGFGTTKIIILEIPVREKHNEEYSSTYTHLIDLTEDEDDDC